MKRRPGYCALSTGVASAWRAAASYDVRRASVTTWLLTITRNAAIDATRSRRPMPTGDDVLEQLLLDSVSDRDAEEAALQHVESEHALARLRQLPPEQARAVVLAVIGGCTGTEIAEQEGIPPGTAKTRVRAGLQRLRASMREVDSD